MNQTRAGFFFFGGGGVKKVPLQLQSDRRTHGRRNTKDSMGEAKNRERASKKERERYAR